MRSVLEEQFRPDVPQGGLATVGDVQVSGVDATPSAPPRRGRLLALDAVRGFAIVVMLLSMSPGTTADLPEQLHHASWNGLRLVDLVFPLFLFAVGISTTLSSRRLDVRHALHRAVVLALMGVALATLKNEGFRLTGVLQHIAGAYLLAFAVLRLPRRCQLPVAVGLVGLLWIAFTAWVGPGDDPWGEAGTLAHAVDGWLLGGFTAEGTLQTVASAVTVLGGAFVGRMIRRGPGSALLSRQIGRHAAALVTLGMLLTVVVPLNKKLWTPSFTVLTIGTSCAFLAAGIWLVDVRRFRRATAPLIHLGSNPMLIYALSMAVLFSLRNWGDALTPEFALAGSDMLGAMAYAVGWVALWWLLAFVLYRRRVFVKI